MKHIQQKHSKDQIKQVPNSVVSRRSVISTIYAFFVLIVVLYGAWMCWRSEKINVVRSVTISLAAGDQMILGRKELGAPAAEDKHLELFRNQQGNWLIRNHAAYKSVWVQPKQGQGFALGQEGIFKSAQIMSIAGKLWSVEVKEGMLWLVDTANNRRYRWDGKNLITPESATIPDKVTLLPTGAKINIPECKERNWLSWSKQFTIGGVKDCANQIAFDEMPERALVIRQTDGNYIFRAQYAWAQKICIYAVGKQCEFNDFIQNQSIKLNDIDYMIIGRSRFSPRLENGKLHLDIVQRGQRQVMGDSTEEVSAQINGVQQIVQAEKWFDMPWTSDESAGWSVIMAVIALVGIYRMISISNYGCWKVCFMSMGGIMALGMLMHFSLALIAEDTGGWQRFNRVTLVNWVTVLIWLGCVRFRPKKDNKYNRGKLPWFTKKDKLFKSLFCISCIALFVQFHFGNEGGVWGVQPIEWVKAVFVISGATVFALYFEGAKIRKLSFWDKCVELLMFVGLLACLCVLALAMLKDFSPILLIGIYMYVIAIFFFLQLEKGNMWRWFCIGLSLLLLISIYVILQYIIYNGDGDIVIPFYPSRFDVWLNPKANLISGSQYWSAKLMMEQAGWLPNSEINGWLVPAVVDDMAPSYFWGRFGKIWGIILLIFQILWVLSLVMLGAHALGKKSENGVSNEKRFQLVWAAYAYLGMVGMIVGHYILSWGSNTGLTPIMGQPMPLISAGGSITLMFVGLLFSLQIYLAQQINLD